MGGPPGYGAMPPGMAASYNIPPPVFGMYILLRMFGASWSVLMWSIVYIGENSSAVISAAPQLTTSATADVASVNSPGQPPS
jgi:hypothetical protein